MELEHIWKIYANGRNPVPVLRDVSFEVLAGEFTLVCGPSGSGKSTLLKLMGLLDVPSKGRILIEGTDAAKLSETDRAKIRNRKIGFVFQSFNLISELTVLENIMLPSWIESKRAPDAKQEALALTKMVGLQEKVGSPASHLSGGQMQRVAIARALINHPSVLLADEPTGNLDSKNAQQVMELFKKLSRENGQTIVLVSHDPKHQRDADRVVRILDGQVDNSGTKSGILPEASIDARIEVA